MFARPSSNESAVGNSTQMGMSKDANAATRTSFTSTFRPSSSGVRPMSRPATNTAR
jgi:hypothetical protein